jgi:hypothetical protein
MVVGATTFPINSSALFVTVALALPPLFLPLLMGLDRKLKLLLDGLLLVRSDLNELIPVPLCCIEIPQFGINYHLAAEQQFLFGCFVYGRQPIHELFRDF